MKYAMFLMGVLVMILAISVFVVLYNKDTFNVDYLAAMPSSRIASLGSNEKDDLYSMRYGQFYALPPSKREDIKKLMGFTEDPPTHF